MTKRQFVAELAAIFNLLKEHAFLQYSPRGQLEYRQKEELAEESFVLLLSAYTGLDLSGLGLSLVQISSNARPSIEEAVKIARRVSATSRRLASQGHTGQSGAWLATATSWECAIENLRRADGRLDALSQAGGGT